MSIKFNPFMPDKPVHIAMFVGRLGELKKLESVLSQTRLGNPKNFLITGERGIGKSSLLLYVCRAPLKIWTGIIV